MYIHPLANNSHWLEGENELVELDYLTGNFVTHCFGVDKFNCTCVDKFIKHPQYISTFISNNEESISRKACIQVGFVCSHCHNCSHIIH